MILICLGVCRKCLDMFPKSTKEDAATSKANPNMSDSTSQRSKTDEPPKPLVDVGFAGMGESHSTSSAVDLHGKTTVNEIFA